MKRAVEHEHERLIAQPAAPQRVVLPANGADVQGVVTEQLVPLLSERRGGVACRARGIPRQEKERLVRR